MIAVAIGLRAVNPDWIETLRVRTFDIYQQVKPRPIGEYPVAIIDLDEKSLAEIGQWPWPRTTVAQLIEKLGAAGVAVVGFDIVYAEPDRMSPALFAQTLSNADTAMVETLRQLPSNESVMAEAMKRTPVVVGQAAIRSALPDGKQATKSQSSVKGQLGGDPIPVLERFVTLLPNVPELEAAAAGHGNFAIGDEVDGLIRRVPLVVAVGEKDVRPALSLEMLRVAFRGRTIVTKRNEAGMESVILQTPGGKFELPTDGSGRIWVHFSTPDTFNTPDNSGRLYISASDVLKDRVGKERLQGRLVLVGTSAVGLQDIRATPIAPRMPGVEVHANILETIFAAQQTWGEALQARFKELVSDGMPQADAQKQALVEERIRTHFLEYPAYANSVEMALIVVAGLLLLVLVPRVGPIWTLVGFTVATSGLFGLSWYLYTQEKLLIDFAYPSAVALAIYAVLTFANYSREAAEKKQVRGAFSQYLSPALVEQLAENPDQLKLGGETKTMTMLFCDVRGFTSISETYKSNPVGLTVLINRLLTPLTDVILARGGTIDKYMGDCIMAFWNAPIDVPEQEKKACDAALNMFTALEALNVVRRQEAEEQGVTYMPLNIGIGVNTGDVVVGNMGSEQRFDYSVLGDAVNLAARLEGQSKTYGVGTVLGPLTAARAADTNAMLELDQIAVKGKKEAVTIFGLLGDKAVLESEAFLNLKAEHDRMIAAYRRQDWDAAEMHIQAARANPLAPLDLYELYAERIAAFRPNPPPADWDGVFVATSK